MFTLEQKVDLILRYIATTDKAQRTKLKKLVVQALESDADAVASARVIPDDVDMIFDLLKELGMPPHLLGYGYTICAIKLAMDDHTYLRQITDRLYPEIASRYNTTPSRVERAMRHAIECVFDRGDMKQITRVFGNTMSIKRGKLTNREFISFCVYEIERRIRNK